MMSIFYIIIGIFIIAAGVVFFYRHKNKQPSLNTKQEPVIQLDTIDNCLPGIQHCEPRTVYEVRQCASTLDCFANSAHNDETRQVIIPRPDGVGHFINDAVVYDLAEIEEQVVINTDDFTNDAAVTHDLIDEEQAVIDKGAEEERAEGDMDIIMLQIKALADRPYAGYELLQALTSSGLNFGKMNIFHGNNFSVAAATTEGSFPVDNMGSFKCLGLMVFMQLNPKKQLMVTFDLMLDTAKQLVEELGGEIYDDLNQPINTATIKKLREKICTIEG